MQRAVGRGGFGEVYYAVSDGGREVALKYLRENPQVELRGTAHCINLKSPHLVTIFDVKKNADGDYFIIMEYVSGPSLRDILVAEPNGLGPQKTAFFVREIAKGLAYLHDRGIVHRDLKPGNIFYEEGYVKIGDYGLSKFISVSRHSAQTASVGTVHYMAPEVGTGNYHRGIDIYALGVMLYEMLLGKVPFEGSSMGEVLMKHLTVQPEVDDLPEPYGRVIRKALQKDPADRYQNVYEMVDDLLEVENVRTSLAGFNPASLSAAVARGAADASPSPSPSPNPAPRMIPPIDRPRPVPAFDLDARRLPRKMEKRLVRTGEKVDEKLRKLAIKHGQKAPDQPTKRRRGNRAGLPQNLMISRGEAVQRCVMATMMLAAMGVAVGFIAGGIRHPELMIGSVTTILGMTLGLTLGIKLVSLISRGHPQPSWVPRLCMVGATVIPLFACAIPIIAYREEAGVFTCLALLATVLIVNWRKRVVSGARGELSIGQAFGAGLLALILTAIFTADSYRSEPFLAIGAGAAAASSLMIQALAWFFPLRYWLDGERTRSTPRDRQSDSPPASAEFAMSSSQMETLSYRGVHGADDRYAADDNGTSSHQPMAEHHQLARDEFEGHGRGRNMDSFVHPPHQVPRYAITRILGGIVGMAMLAATAGLTLALFNLRSARDPVHFDSFIMMCLLLTGAVCLMFFAFRKTSRYRSGGFYRDTLRPLLLFLPILGFAKVATLKYLEQRGNYGVSSDEELVLRAVLVASAILLVVLLFKRGERYPRHRLPMPADQSHESQQKTREPKSQPVNVA